jgi:hypothetical protein
MVKSFINCGVLRYNKDGTIDFEIKDFSSINNIFVPHFLKYTLKGTKYLYFVSFNMAFDILNNEENPVIN